MILVLVVLNFIFFSNLIQAKSFSYQLNIADNIINLDFYRAIDFSLSTLNSTPNQNSTLISQPTLTATPTQDKSKKILAFDYKIMSNRELPIGLPLFIVVFDQQVIFSIDATLADGMSHHVEIDLELFDQNYIGQTPIFYQNNYLNDYKLSLGGLSFLEKFSSIDSNESVSEIEIKDLSVIREADQSLTIIFSLDGQEKIIDSYTLICKDENQKLLNSSKLVKTDDFLWPNFIFSNFSVNYKNDLIFHLEEFNCGGLMSLVSESGKQLNILSIVEVKDL